MNSFGCYNYKKKEESEENKEFSKYFGKFVKN